MTKLGDIRTHFWQTLGMARATGVDLSEVMRQGKLSRADYADLVTACRGCAWSEDCREWLDKTRGRPAETPKPCANKVVWDDLRESV